MTVVYLDLETRRSLKAPAKPVPVKDFLYDLSQRVGELSDDWLFEMVSPEMKRAMLAERGIAVAA